MEKKLPEDYQLEDFVTDESFFNYHFKLNRQDQLLWEEWIKNNPSSIRLVKEAESMLQNLSLTIPESEYKEQFEQIKAAININKEPSTFRLLSWNKAGQRKRRMARYLIPIVLIVLLGGGYWYLQSPKEGSRQLAVKENNTNEPLEMLLSDSTVVTLQPHSRLNYPATFDGKDRNVYLYGDAQFHVKRNEQHPFKVYADNVIATVLGTVFNVKQSEDSAIVVELLKGSLNVEVTNKESGKKESILLHPSERAVYMRQDKRFYGDKLTPVNHLEFNKDTFEEIAAKIKEEFGITVINNSNKKDWRFTGEFKNTTAKDIIESICFVKGLTFEVNESTIVIK